MIMKQRKKAAKEKVYFTNHEEAERYALRQFKRGYTVMLEDLSNEFGPNFIVTLITPIKNIKK